MFLVKEVGEIGVSVEKSLLMQEDEVLRKGVNKRLWIVHIAVAENPTVGSCVLCGKEIILLYYTYIIIIGDGSYGFWCLNAEEEESVAEEKCLFRLVVPEGCVADTLETVRFFEFLHYDMSAVREGDTADFVALVVD